MNHLASTEVTTPLHAGILRYPAELEIADGTGRPVSPDRECRRPLKVATESHQKRRR